MKILIISPAPDTWKVVTMNVDENGNSTPDIDNALAEVADGEYPKSLQELLMRWQEKIKEGGARG